MKNSIHNSYRTDKVGRAAQNLGRSLEKQILAGKWRAGEFLPSVRQLCETHDTCIDTAFRALRSLEASGLLASEPRRGYRVLPRANSRELGCPLAFVVPSAGGNALNILQAQMAGYYQESAARQGLALLIIGIKGQTQATILNQLSAARAWGVVFNADDPPLLAALLEQGLPVVAADSISRELTVDEVNQDGFRGGLLAGEYLGAREHRRIGWLGYPVKDGDPQAVERYAGALGGLARHGKALTPEFNLEIPTGDPAAAYKAARKMLAHPQRPTAIFALWQDFQIAVTKAAAELGLVLGKDLEMVGWSSMESYESQYVSQFAAGAVPPAVTWSVATMVESAMARLEERRNNPQLPVIHLRIPTQLRLHADK